MADNERIQCMVYRVPKTRKYYEVCGRMTGDVDDKGQPIMDVVSDRDVTNEMKKRF